MTPDILGDALAKFRRPGMIKALAGQLAIAIGSSLVASTVEEAEERRDAAHDEMEKLIARIEAGRAGILALIEEGDFDVAVLNRAHELGYVYLPDDDVEDQADDVHTCGDPVCAERGECSEGHPLRTPTNGAPTGQPDVPPRMDGGYLGVVPGMNPEIYGTGPAEDIQHNGNPFTNPIEVRDVGGNVGASADAD